MSGTDRVIVVGGGLGGLVAARAFALAGREVLLLEREAQLGGRLRSHSVGGITLDAGVDAFRLHGDELPRLLRALGLEGDVEGARDARTWLHRATGDAVPLPALSVWGIPGVPLARDVTHAIGAGAAWRAQLDGLLPGLVASKAATLEQLVIRRMGRGVLEGLVAPVVRAAYAATPAELELDQLAPGVSRRVLSAGNLSGAVRSLLADAGQAGRRSTLRGGLFRLADALGAELERFGVEVRTGAEIVAADAESVRSASGETLTGEVVLGAPLDEPRTHVTLVTLAFDAPELAENPRGAGVVVAAGAPDVGAARLDHLTATWGWLSDASALQFVRLSYEAGVDATPAAAHRDAEVLLGRSLPRPIDSATVGVAHPRWHRDAEHAIDGMQRVGESRSGPDLSRVVSYAARVAGATP